MLARIHTALKQLCVRFALSRDGSVLHVFALSLLPLVAMIGAAVDYSNANNVRTGMQATLDSALLAGARDGSANWANIALNYFNANIQAKGSSVATPSFKLTQNRAYTGTASASVPTDFLRVMGVSAIPVNVSATATVASTSGAYYCVIALNQTAQAALQLTGNATITITAPKCVLQVNSKDLDAVDLTGNSYIKSVENCFVGGVRTVGNSSIAPPPDPSCKPIPDPFAAYPRPAVGPCDHTNFKVSGGATMTLLPGVYCGGMTFSGAVNITFAPGLFIIKDGVIAESGGTFTGNGVTFFLTGLGASLQLSGQANWHLVAPSNGPLPGFAIFLDPNGPSGLAASYSTLSGQSELFFEGVIYLPQQRVTVSGTAGAVATSPYTSFIADTLNFVGNGELIINNDATKTALPIPTALMAQTNGRLALTQ